MMPDPVCVLNDEFAVKVSRGYYHVFRYHEDLDAITKIEEAGSVILDRRAVRKLADIEDLRISKEFDAITAEQRIDNELNALLKLIDGEVHKHRMAAIRATAHQLCDLWQQYKAGELMPLAGDDCPF